MANIKKKNYALLNLPVKNVSVQNGVKSTKTSHICYCCA